MKSLTKEELYELGISEDLFYTWQEIMNSMYKTLRKEYPENTSTDNENTIIINPSEGIEWTVNCYFVNEKYLTVEATKNGVEMLTVRFDGIVSKIVAIVKFLIYDK